MDQGIQRALNDKLYDKRKVGALDLERVIRDLAAAKEFDRIKKIIQQLCNDYAYAVHQPHARNGGLIGLAAAAIALGPDLARYLDEIVPPVLACFTDQDARVRYYACESMYNIAKVAKGEVLPYFNHIFDALCKASQIVEPPKSAFELMAEQLGADSELSVKNGAELLDRLIKDIVSESAATYVSILHTSDDSMSDSKEETLEDSEDLPTAFSLARFIPLLKERIYVINPFTRTFLVGWITLLDSIPDLELVSFLPEFLGGLFKFLSDPNRDVHVATQGALERFLNEIKRISRIKKGIEESRKSRSDTKRKRSGSMDSDGSEAPDGGADDDSVMDPDDKDISSDDDWVPGQDVHCVEEDSLLESLRWIVEFLDICPEEVLPFAPKILAHLLPAMASGVETIRQAAARVNTSLMDYVVSLSDEGATSEVPSSIPSRFPSMKETNPTERRDSSATNRGSLSGSRELDKRETDVQTPPPPASKAQTPTPPNQPQVDLDYAAAVSSLTLLFLNDHEATRVAALTWLLMLHRKAPKKVLAFNDGTFPALLKTLSDPAEAVVTKDLQLLSQISRNSEDDYFTSFMVNLLQLFSTDRKLLETRGNLIIRQLTLADCIEKEEDVEFASIMVQNLNNNLITAPELAELRKRLRNIENKVLKAFGYRDWSLLTAELEMTVNMLIQIDKLVQLLESPVFTYLRLQLLEPEKYPHLYKCLYGLLMLLPQSSAFAALKNRLNSVSAIGYLHIAPRAYVSSSRNNSVADAFSTFALHQRQKSGTETHASSPSFSVQATAGPSNYDRTSRLKGGREESGIRWGELLEKFRSVQEKARRARRPGGDMDDGLGGFETRMEAVDGRGFKDLTRLPGPPPQPIKEPTVSMPAGPQHTKSRSSLGKFGRLGGAVAGGRPRK
ncbi:putative enzyme activator VAC14 protein [Rutstroemia sp. NJR-2017a BBW]|nr:putative enzyme activator VAC14 protein [Rutstroemia sp. NJR-2017a BBW]